MVCVCVCVYVSRCDMQVKREKGGERRSVCLCVVCLCVRVSDADMQVKREKGERETHSVFVCCVFVCMCHDADM